MINQSLSYCPASEPCRFRVLPKFHAKCNRRLFFHVLFRCPDPDEEGTAFAHATSTVVTNAIWYGLAPYPSDSDSRSYRYPSKGYRSWRILRYHRSGARSNLLEIVVPPLSATPVSGCAIPFPGMRLPSCEELLHCTLY